MRAKRRERSMRISDFLHGSGKPLATSNIVRRHLHPALKSLGHVNPITGDYKAGNHGFRRFRKTFLRNYTKCPGGLRNFWLGHADQDMDDLYDKIREDSPFRKKRVRRLVSVSNCQRLYRVYRESKRVKEGENPLKLSKCWW
jgi:integrase